MSAASPAGGLTRRGAIAGLASALSAPALAGLRSDPDFDVLIVGAGAAGIAAARRLAGSKFKFGVLEASDRRGGRCFTDATTFGMPYDRGACLLHLPARSSLAAQAARSGAELYPDPELLQFRIRGRKAFDRGLEEVRSKIDLEQFYAERVRCYGAIASAAAGKDDVSCTDALPADLGDWRKTLEFFLGPYRCGAELKELSAKEYATSFDRGPAQLCRQGAGSLISKLALGLPVKFFSPVQQIDWSDRVVALETASGTLTARAVIVTASTALVAAGRIKFKPNLPAPQVRAFETLKLGSYDRVAIEFTGTLAGLDGNEVVFEKVGDGKPAALLANLHGTRLAVLSLCGKTAADLSAEGEKAMLDFAIDWVTGVFGANAKKAIVRTHATSWNKQMWTLGAFSTAVPGAQGARKLAAEPLGERVWFAGEALSPSYWGTVGGAWQDGERAADAVVARLGK
jgi:monoamine oxidase